MTIVPIRILYLANSKDQTELPEPFNVSNLKAMQKSAFLQIELLIFSLHGKNYNTLLKFHEIFYFENLWKSQKSVEIIWKLNNSSVFNVKNSTKDQKSVEIFYRVVSPNFVSQKSSELLSNVPGFYKHLLKIESQWY